MLTPEPTAVPAHQTARNPVATQPVPTPHIADLIAVLRILVAYGRHLLAILSNHRLPPAFIAIARFLGGDGGAGTLAHIQRGILRAVALEAMLRNRARRGRDLTILVRPVTRCRPAPAPDAPSAAKPRRQRLDNGQPLSPDSLPTLEQMQAQVRRQPVGRTIAAICLDLGVAPRLCNGAFWNSLFNAMLYYRGNLTGTIMELYRRETRFDDHAARTGRTFPQSASAARQVLGYLIGDPPPARPHLPEPPHPEPTGLPTIGGPPYNPRPSPA